MCVLGGMSCRTSRPGMIGGPAGGNKTRSGDVGPNGVGWDGDGAGWGWWKWMG